MHPVLRWATAARRRKHLLLVIDGSPAPDSLYTTFVSANYTPDPDGVTATTLTFTVHDENDDPMADYGVTYA